MRAKLLVAFLVLVAGMAIPAFAALSDSDAMAAARKIWGDNAAISRFRKYGDAVWTYQVGCIDSTTFQFIVAGKAPGTWDGALASVDMKANGPRTLTAVATDVNGLQTTSAPITVYACNPQAPPVTQ